MIDNTRLAHAREPFTGERLILVALAEAYVRPHRNKQKTPMHDSVRIEATNAHSTPWCSTCPAARSAKSRAALASP